MPNGAPKYSQAIIVWLIAGLVAGLSLLNHLVSPSSFHLPDQAWNSLLAYHRDFAAFRLRPLTTGLVSLLAEQCGFSVRNAFFSLQFTLLFLTGPAFYWYLRTLRFSFRQSLAGMLILLLSLPVFLAHFEPVWTWSDFWTYLFLPLSLAFAVRRSYAAAVVCITLAMIARETSAAFLPILFLLALRDRKTGVVAPLTILLTPVAAFLLFRAVILGSVSSTPVWSLPFNFESWLRTRDSLFSVIVSLGFVWIVGLTQALRRSPASVLHLGVIRFGAVLTTLAFLTSGLIYGQIRESRLLLPPAIFLIPLVLVYFEDNRPWLASLRDKFAPTFGHSAVVLILLAGVSLVMAKLLFPDFEYRRWRDGNWIYLALHLALVFIVLGIEIVRSRCHPTTPGAANSRSKVPG